MVCEICGKELRVIKHVGLDFETEDFLPCGGCEWTRKMDEGMRRELYQKYGLSVGDSLVDSLREIIQKNHDLVCHYLENHEEAVRLVMSEIRFFEYSSVLKAAEQLY